MAYQSSLGEPDIAEELAAGQRQISIAEFFEKNKHMLGFDSGARALVSAVKEGVDNSLDATEEAGFLPDIYVEISETGEYYTVVIEDNGPGITKEQIPKIFGKLLYGSRFHKREQSLTPGQQLLIRRSGRVESIPIGVFCDAYLPREGAATEPIPDDIEVPSFNRQTHEMSWQPVTHAIRHETDEQTYRISTEKGRSVEVTGNHSLFSISAEGATEEVKAGDLSPGDYILAPKQLPRPERPVEAVNLLNHIDVDQIRDNRIYVYGFETETLDRLRSGEIVRKRPADDSSRKRSYYRYNGVDVLKDSFDNQYRQKGFLPIETVLELGWEDEASDCELRTYRVGGDVTSIPVTLPLDDDLVSLLAYYISEGHVDARQVGFTFHKSEHEYIETTERAIAGIGGSTTLEERDRNSTRERAFGLPIRLFLENTCGAHARNKRVPDFIFNASQRVQRRFLAALIEGDGSDRHPANVLEHSTTSETLARQVSVLWNQQGVLASTYLQDNTNGYAPDSTRVYNTKVHGVDADLLDEFGLNADTGEQTYKRIPTPLLSDVQFGPVYHETVPDSIAGLLMGAGVGSTIKHARVYEQIIEAALNGDFVQYPRYVFNLKQKGLLDDDHHPTEALHELWETVNALQGFTDSDMCLLKVTDVEETNPPDYVYDISVPGATGTDENFVVANEGALSVKNSRGQQGIGISAAVLYSQLTSGTPAKITSRTPGGTEARYFEIVIDTENNEPEIRAEDTTTWDRPHGTRIELTMEANMRARTQLHDYITYTAVVNPHARIELVEPGEHLKFDRVTDELPEETESIRPHPHGVELGTLLKMVAETDSYSVSGFLQNEFARVGQKTAADIIDAFKDSHFGREMRWALDDDIELVDVVAAGVANKSAEATDDFAEAVADRVRELGTVGHSDLVSVVEEIADEIEAAHDETFGSTVRQNAVAEAWSSIREHRAATLASLVDEATSNRKATAVVEALAERLGAKFDETERDRATRRQLVDFVERSANMTVERDDVTVGETARENVVEAVWSYMETVPDEAPPISAIDGDRDVAAALLDGMRAVDVMAPPTNCLAPIRAELIEEGLKKEFDADFYGATTRDADVHGGDPFIVEAGIAYGGGIEPEGQIELMRFANRVPLVYQQGACAITDVVKSIDWRNYGLDQSGGSGLPAGPGVIAVHVGSTNVPFTSESKDAIANIPTIEHEIELAIREVARELKTHLNRRESLERRRRKQTVIADILPKMATKVAAVTGRAEPDVSVSLARIMNNVLVTREVDGDRVELVVENNTTTNADLEVTEIVSVEPGDLSAGTPIDMGDDEWYVRWQPSVKSGEKATLSYEVANGAEFDVHVEGIEAEKLTIEQ